MSVYVSQEDWEEQRGVVTEDEWKQIDALLRRAERELAILVGDLSQFDPQLVKDTLIDAIVVGGTVTNPEGFKSETDGDYSYVRFDLPDGLGKSRFWWPLNLCVLFGDPDTPFCNLSRGGGKVTTHSIRTSCAMRGWVS